MSVPVSPEAICGVYFLFQDETLVYVGKARRYFTRLAEHLRLKRGYFNRMAFIPIGRGLVATVEAAYIREYMPELNVVIPISIPPPWPAEKYLMTRHDTARLMGIDLRRLRALHCAKVLTNYAEGRNSFYDLREISVWIANQP